MLNTFLLCKSIHSMETEGHCPCWHRVPCWNVPLNNMLMTGLIFHKEIPNLLKGKQKVYIILLVSYRSKCQCCLASILVPKLDQLFSIFPVHMLKEENQIPQVILWFSHGIKTCIEISKHLHIHKLINKIKNYHVIN